MGVIWSNLVVIWGESMVDSWSESTMSMLHWFLHDFWSLDSGSDSKMLILHVFSHGFRKVIWGHLGLYLGVIWVI